MILVKRFKETTATCKMVEGTVTDEYLLDMVQTIMNDIPKDRPEVVWAQVEVRCSVKVIEELTSTPPQPDGA